MLVFFLDRKTHRWFRLQGVGSLQPSEFAKPALIIFFAYFVTQKREAINRRRTIDAASLALAVLAATGRSRRPRHGIVLGCSSGGRVLRRGAGTQIRGCGAG